MSVSETLEQAQESVSEFVDVDTPRNVGELDAFLGVGSVYNPVPDTLEINAEKPDEEVRKSVEGDLIAKYIVDETVGDTGIQEIEELEQQVDTYRGIEGFEILEEEETRIRSTEEIHDELIDEHGEEMEEIIEEVEEMGSSSRLDDEEENDVDMEQMRELEESSEEMAKENLKRSIGEDDEVTRRLAALHLSDDFDQTIEEYRQQYQDMEQRKEEVRDEYWDERDEITDELEELVEDEEALEAAFEVKAQAMEFDLETGKVDLKIDRELRGEETEPIGTGYDREDIAEALRSKGIEDEDTIDRVYELFREEEELEAERDETIDELREQQTGLYDELMDELDERVDEMEREIDLYTEPINQRQWKVETLPVMEVAASLKTLYRAHQDGLLEMDREDYQSRLEAAVDQRYKSPEEVNKYLNKMIDVYEMQDGTPEEKLQATFEQAPEYAS